MSAPNPTQKPTKKPMSEARIGGMVATAALVLIFLFTILFVWIA
jgi:hypothetical protein